MTESNSNGGGSCLGCIMWIFLLFFIFGGLSIGGINYRLAGCDCVNGIKIKEVPSND